MAQPMLARCKNNVKKASKTLYLTGRKEKKEGKRERIGGLTASCSWSCWAVGNVSGVFSSKCKAAMAVVIRLLPRLQCA